MKEIIIGVVSAVLASVITFFIISLINAPKELEKKVDSLAERASKLEGKVACLKK